MFIFHRVKHSATGRIAPGTPILAIGGRFSMKREIQTSIYAQPYSSQSFDLEEKNDIKKEHVVHVKSTGSGVGRLKFSSRLYH